MPLYAQDGVKLVGVDRRLIRFARAFARFIERTEGDLDLVMWITSGKRSVGLQDVLYKQGRTLAKGETAPHVQGRAIDIAYGDEYGPYPSDSVEQEWWTLLQQKAKQQGLQSPAGSKFPGHVQVPPTR